MDLSPVERELLKSVGQLAEQSNNTVISIKRSTDRLALSAHNDMLFLAGCVKSLAECQMRLVDWCKASAAEAAVDGSATKALEQAQQDLLRKLKTLE